MRIESNAPKDIFFGWQSHCGNDCLPQEWILSTKVSTQLLIKCPKGKTLFSALCIFIIEDRISCPKRHIFRMTISLWEWLRTSRMNFEHNSFHYSPSKMSEKEPFVFRTLHLYYRGSNLKPQKTYFSDDNLIVEWLRTSRMNFEHNSFHYSPSKMSEKEPFVFRTLHLNYRGSNLMPQKTYFSDGNLIVGIVGVALWRIASARDCSLDVM
jgi:hypothetical protein